ncbi:hypothetical protein EDC04DRAFT_3134378 [Pisolithus marmoratus]|nr:hypothetical protein EDC04DRAFT_3134378 [Pisolithus marmoratus]
MGFSDRFTGLEGPNDILPTDTVVFIIGISDPGKSRFLSALQFARVDVPVTKGQECSTTGFNAERCRLDGMEGDIVLVDVPSLFCAHEEPDIGNNMKRSWTDLNCLEPCKAAGVLYMHDIASAPRHAKLDIPNHLEAFRSTCPRNLNPSAVHVIPTTSFRATSIAESIVTLALLQHQVECAGASMFPNVFDGRPTSAWDAVLWHLERIARDSEVLEWIMTVRRTTLKHMLPGHPDHSLALMGLISVLSTRYQKYGGKVDLDDLITLRQVVLECTPLKDPKRKSGLINLGDCLFQRFKRDGAMEDLMEAITLRRAVLDLTPPEHQEYITFVVNLASCLEQQFNREGAMEVLTEAITLWRTVVDINPLGRREHLISLASLSDCLSQRFGKEGAMEDMAEVITLRRTVLDLTPMGHRERLVSLVKLANSLDQRFGREGAMDDLVEVVTLRRDALHLIPLEHRECSISLANLANSLEQRFRRQGTMEDLAEAIILRHEVLDLTPLGHREHLASLVNLANSLDQRFEREGSMEDLKEIITLRRAVLDLTPLGHQERLGALANLANSLDMRFSRKSGMEDLTEIITLRYAVLDLTPAGHRERLASLDKLASCLDQRFGREGAMEDLAEIITLLHFVLELTPPGHPEYVSSRMKLANYLEQRFRKENTMEDLRELITLRRIAIELAPPDFRREYLLSLVDLANNLDIRFGEQGSLEDLTKIITIRDAVLELTPAGHDGRQEALIKLANCLEKQFKKEDSLAALEHIISLRRAALECGSQVPCDQYGPRLCLANFLCEKIERTGVKAELEEALTHAHATLEFCPPELYTSALDCLANCISLKIKKWGAPIHAVGSHPSSIQQMVRKAVNDTLTAIPLRLLNTLTGILCDRDAQISYFECSSQYRQLLSLASMCDGPQWEARMHEVVSTFFQYVTLSHRWGKGEPLLHDIEGRNVYDLSGKDGLRKLQNFCLLALRHHYIWGWSDTCCIDKESSAELQEAIGSMFSWYHQSSLTIVHLSDVSGTVSLVDSVWFKRGWTLQELLASPRVLFYTQDWSLYKNCTSLDHKKDCDVLSELRDATGVGEGDLKHFHPGMQDARLKLTWASRRSTTRPEDIAYSLFGIFKVHLPALYGESAEHALGRLLAEIIAHAGNVAVLDWVGIASSFHSCFPAKLEPYSVMPGTHLPSRTLSRHGGLDVEIKQLCSNLANLPRPQFVNHRLVLHCITHGVTVVKLRETLLSTQPYVYEIHASGLMPLKFTSSVQLEEGSGTNLQYVLVRPWHPPPLHLLAGDATDTVQNLQEQLSQPFNALLLMRLLHNEYRRIASDCAITACPQDLASIVGSELQKLEIV